MVRYIWIKKDVKPGRGIKMKYVRIPDKGKPGKTPKSKRWAEFKGSLHGWKKDLPDNARHEAIMKTVRAEGVNVAKKKLVQLANITTDRKTKIMARRDFLWLRNRFPPKVR